jgi:hypothetical protein
MGKATENLAKEARGILDAIERVEAKGWELARICADAVLEQGSTKAGRAAGRVPAAEFAMLVDRPRFGTRAVEMAVVTWRRYGDEVKRLHWSDGSELSYGDHHTAMRFGPENLREAMAEAERTGTTLSYLHSRGLRRGGDQDELETARRVLLHPERVEQVLDDRPTARSVEAAQSRQLDDRLARRAGIGDDERYAARQREAQREREDALSPQNAWRLVSKEFGRAWYALKAGGDELTDRSQYLDERGREHLLDWLEAIEDLTGMLKDTLAAGDALTDEALAAFVSGLDLPGEA